MSDSVWTDALFTVVCPKQAQGLTHCIPSGGCVVCGGERLCFLKMGTRGQQITSRPVLQLQVLVVFCLFGFFFFFGLFLEREERGEKDRERNTDQLPLTHTHLTLPQPGPNAQLGPVPRPGIKLGTFCCGRQEPPVRAILVFRTSHLLFQLTADIVHVARLPTRV